MIEIIQINNALADLEKDYEEVGVESSDEGEEEGDEEKDDEEQHGFMEKKDNKLLNLI